MVASVFKFCYLCNLTRRFVVIFRLIWSFKVLCLPREPTTGSFSI